MNEIVKSFNRKFKHIWKFILQDSKVFYLFKISLALSTMSFVMLVYLLRKNEKLILKYSENIGYLRLIKPDVNKYEILLRNNKSINNEILNKVVKKFYAYPNGITNFGNNCYLNVLIQCLASNPDFIIYLKNFMISGELKNLNKKDLDIIKELEEVLEKINNEKSVLTPYNLVNNINNKYSFEHEQQDSYELYHRILEIFNGESMVESEYNISNNPFLIEFENKYTCKKCGNVLIKKEHNLDISITPDYSAYSVTQLIDKSFKPIEISDYTCSKCTSLNILNQIERKIKISSVEEIKKFEKLKYYLKEMTREHISESLEIIVKRIVEYCDENNLNDILNKLNLLTIKSNLNKTQEILRYPKILTVHVQKVFFEEDVVMTNKLKIVFPENLIFRNKQGERINYELTSFIEHFGSHSFGHYIAYRKFYEKWVIINDSIVKLIEKNKAFEVSNPYILFYRLLDQ